MKYSLSFAGLFAMTGTLVSLGVAYADIEQEPTVAQTSQQIPHTYQSSPAPRLLAYSESEHLDQLPEATSTDSENKSSETTNAEAPEKNEQAQLDTPERERAYPEGLSPSWQRSALRAIETVEAKYGTAIRNAAEQHGLETDFLTAVIVVESFGDPNARSHANAVGLMQVRRVAANDVGVTGSLWNPSRNIRAGSKYLAHLRDQYGFKSEPQIAVAYNTGPGNAEAMSGTQINDHRYAKRIAFVLKND